MPAMACIRRSLLVAIAFGAQSLQAKDPIQDFCRRWGHQTAQVDNKLYIDGGQVAWNPISTNPLNYTNTWLLYSDLNSTTQGVGQPYQYANLTKNSTVPSVSGGVLWADNVNKCFYQFGGEYQSNPSDFSFWTYDTRLNQWNETNPKSNVASLQRVAYGAGTQMEDFGYGYYFGGYMNNLTSPTWKGGQVATSNLISYDFTAGQLNNNSGPPDNYGRAEGQLVYLPASDGGLLVYFGGIEDPGRNGSSQAANMSIIHIYDISSNKWYTQQASGQVPEARRQFCAGVTWADDQSSYNIYLYGGFAAEGPGGFDDAYILSLPSFKWINVFSTGNSTNTQPFPHGGCSANVIHRDQMLIIGGWFTNPSYTDCDSPNSQGQHNMNLGYNGPKNVLWDKFDPSATKYFVPTPVISVIGGGPTGGATLTKPSNWDNGDLGVYFGRQASFSPRSATRVVPSGTADPSSTGTSKKTNVGAIAGGVVGGLAGLILILLLVLFCLHRRKKKLKAQEEKSQNPSPPPPVELAATSPPREMHSPGTAKYMSLQQHPELNMQSHSRSPSDDYHHPHQMSPYQPQQYQTTSPLSPAIFPSPQNTEYSHHNYAQQDQHHTYNHHLNTYDTQSYDSNVYHQPPGAALQREYSYPTPNSPSHPHTFMPVAQQVYYPPPPEPSTRTRSHQSHNSHSDRMTSPEGTQFSGSDRHTRSPPSTTQTPAQFYAQPVPVRGPHVMSGGNLAPGGFGDEAGSMNDSGSMRSLDSRKRPVRGRFVEVDDL